MQVSSASPPSSARATDDDLEVKHLGIVDYRQAWAMQKRLVAQRASDEIGDVLVLLEHPAVFTAGKRTEASDRPVGSTTPVIDVDRGGKITWHGPGQLVGYPIIKLASPIDVIDYVRRIEQALIASCEDMGLTVGRIAERSGVWLPADQRDGVPLPERKVAAIGLRVSRGVASHGFSLNCNNSLEGFHAIVPCGIADAGVTTLSEELGTSVTVAQMSDRVAGHVRRALSGELPVKTNDLRHSQASVE